MNRDIDLVAAALHYSVLFWLMVVIAGLFLAFGKIEGKKKKRYIFVVSTILFVLMAFRGTYMGNDTKTYITIFNKIAVYSNPFDYIRSSGMESGYLLYCWVLSRISRDARILFVVTAAVVMGSVGRFAYKYVDNVGMFYCLFVGMLQFDFFLSIMRQSVAVAILLYAVDYLQERRLIPYYVLSLLAVSFHNSSILFLLIYPLFSAKSLKKEHGLLSNMIMFSAAFVGGFFFDPIFKLVLRWFPKYSYYIGSARVDGEPRLAIFLKLLVFFLLLVVARVVRKIPARNPKREKAERQMALLNLLVIVVASNATVLMRFSSLFALYTNAHYSNSVGRMRPRSPDKIWLTTLTLLAFYVYGLVLVVLKTPEWQTTYPIQLCLWLK